MISDMITVTEDFQTSVNIAYDLSDPNKIKKLIPTRASIALLEELILSTNDASTQRARILIGAYGKGKSHIILTILSILCQKDASLYGAILDKVRDTKPELYEYIQNYIQSDKRLLPIIISGNSASLTQAFLGALYTAIRQNEMTDILPETQFQAAVNMIGRWKDEFPLTYEKLQEELEQPVNEFIERLLEFDTQAYMTFERLYPVLTSGSEFNPFSGFEVVELYEKVSKNISKYGYNGLFVVYDEFSKYLEANITTASVSDTKMLQDFAEKCSRSGINQLHLLLISHKEVENYIDKLPRQKVDGWRGVSERFSHILMQSDFSQVYEIISAAIIKKGDSWNSFVSQHSVQFKDIISHCEKSPLFNDCSQGEIREVVIGCYPLHPVTTFILPRLSEKIAQNERTMFTFLSGQENNTLPYFIDRMENEFSLITPDVLFDYFSSQLRNEPYTSDIHKTYYLAAEILRKQQNEGIASKIIKTIAIIYCMEQFERLEPTADTIISIYRDAGYAFSEINDAIEELASSQSVIYLQRSNLYFRLKEGTTVDIPQSIADTVEKRRRIISDEEIINNANTENYLYPTKYNDEHEITRYFRFVFSTAAHLQEDVLEEFNADGIVFGVLPDENEEASTITRVKELSQNCERAVFAVPINFESLHDTLREFDAVAVLRDGLRDDPQLYEEYDIVYQDLLEVIQGFITQFTYPEYGRVTYYFKGEHERLYRKANLTQLLSKVCELAYPNTPIINNEVLNKNEISTVSVNSRAKLLNGILNNVGQVNLGLAGNGQEISFMRSTLIMQGLLLQTDEVSQLRLESSNNKLQFVIDKICEFLDATQSGARKLQDLYKLLTGTELGIGMRKGVIPIYLAVVFNKYDGHVIIRDMYGERRITADLLNEVNNHPENFKVELELWSDEKETYIKGLDELFNDYIVEEEKKQGGYSYIIQAMNRWYLSLPRYTKDLKSVFDGFHEENKFQKVDRSKIKFMELLKQPGIGAQDLLFNRLPRCFGYTTFNISLLDNIIATKKFFDTARYNLELVLIEDVKKMISKETEDRSLGSISLDWYESLSSNTHSHLFPNGAERLLAVLSTASNDEHQIINQLAKALMDLRVDDWNEDLVVKFCQRVSEYIDTISEFNKSAEQETPIQKYSANGEYSIVFVDDKGASYTKTFKREQVSKRAKLLLDEISNTIDEMGQSITPQEKRQVLIEALEKFC